MPWAATLGLFTHARAQFFRSFRSIRQAFQQCPEIQTGARSQDRQFLALSHFLEDLQSPSAIFTGGKNLFRLAKVYKVMRDSALFAQRRLGRAYIEILVNLRGIANKYFAV